MHTRASEEARRLGHSWVGPEHVLLAVLAQPSEASKTLEDLGLTHSKLTSFIASMRHHPAPSKLQPGEGPRFNPAFYRTVGWAYGFAAAAGLAKPEDSDWLLATVYRNQQGDDTVLGTLQEFGTSTDAVLEALRRQGLRVPSLKPPPHHPWRGYRMVELAEEEVEAVIKLLSKKHPPGSEWRWGFNWLPGEPRRAYVASEDGIDLEALVAEVRLQGRQG